MQKHHPQQGSTVSSSSITSIPKYSAMTQSKMNRFFDPVSKGQDRKKRRTNANVPLARELEAHQTKANPQQILDDLRVVLPNTTEVYRTNLASESSWNTQKALDIHKDRLEQLQKLHEFLVEMAVEADEPPPCQEYSWSLFQAAKYNVDQAACTYWNQTKERLEREVAAAAAARAEASMSAGDNSRSGSSSRIAIYAKPVKVDENIYTYITPKESNHFLSTVLQEEATILRFDTSSSLLTGTRIMQVLQTLPYTVTQTGTLIWLPSCENEITSLHAPFVARMKGLAECQGCCLSVCLSKQRTDKLKKQQGYPSRLDQDVTTRKHRDRFRTIRNRDDADWAFRFVITLGGSKELLFYYKQNTSIMQLQIKGGTLLVLLPKVAGAVGADCGLLSADESSRIHHEVRNAYNTVTLVLNFWIPPAMRVYSRKTIIERSLHGFLPQYERRSNKFQWNSLDNALRHAY